MVHNPDAVSYTGVMLVAAYEAASGCGANTQTNLVQTWHFHSSLIVEWPL